MVTYINNGTAGVRVAPSHKPSQFTNECYYRHRHKPLLLFLFPPHAVAQFISFSIFLFPPPSLTTSIEHIHIALATPPHTYRHTNKWGFQNNRPHDHHQQQQCQNHQPVHLLLVQPPRKKVCVWACMKTQLNLIQLLHPPLDLTHTHTHKAETKPWSPLSLLTTTNIGIAFFLFYIGWCGRGMHRIMYPLAHLPPPDPHTNTPTLDPLWPEGRKFDVLCYIRYVYLYMCVYVCVCIGIYFYNILFLSHTRTHPHPHIFKPQPLCERLPLRSATPSLASRRSDLRLGRHSHKNTRRKRKRGQGNKAPPHQC